MYPIKTTICTQSQEVQLSLEVDAKVIVGNDDQLDGGVENRDSSRFNTQCMISRVTSRADPLSPENMLERGNPDSTGEEDVQSFF